MPLVLKVFKVPLVLKVSRVLKEDKVLLVPIPQ